MYFILGTRGEGGGGDTGGSKNSLRLPWGISPTYFTLNTRMLSQNICFYFILGFIDFPKKPNKT